ncbi:MULTISPECIES: DUF6124 family protein [Pseudomonas]|jgi:hypothetical protein|uniref:DUF6124 family protein n=1 Tax=Pseudomonas TaxID=286 RepID=UPI0005FB9185|nr:MULTISPECIES: DUF6124 family protein [Pseudomonas]KJZ33349.1 hypothetical protein VC33_27965 [Pseudomonas fluorescens]OOG13896.1 hypothetical protein BMS17_17875 [Pseudomonas sp. C9]PWK44627.1 hypothetical protein C7534_102177 [Pseudomonas sp. OV226]
MPPQPELPETNLRSPYSYLDPRKLHEAAKKALDHYLEPDITSLRSSRDRAMKMFTVAPDANPEALTIQTYETFSSVNILLLDLAESLDDKPRHLAMLIYQLSELGLMLVERSLDNEQAIKRPEL